MNYLCFNFTFTKIKGWKLPPAGVQRKAVNVFPFKCVVRKFDRSCLSATIVEKERRVLYGYLHPGIKTAYETGI